MPKRFAKGQAELERKAEQLKELKLQYLPPSAISPNEYNPNRQSDFEFELLRRSIREDGFTQPVLVNQEMVIVDGEHRWRAAIAEELAEIPVVVVPFGAAQARIATFRHNRARGSEEADLAAQVLRDLAVLGALEEAAEGLMLTPVELERLSAMAPAEDLEELRVIAPDMERGRRQSSSMNGDQLEEAREAERQHQLSARERERLAAVQEEAAEKLKFRLQINYTAEEAETVRAVLGAQKGEQAERVVQLCREELARREVA